jgi:hypothetical protein
MERLKGQKVWVYQFDDDEDSVIGIVDSVANGFISLRYEGDPAPALYVNLTNVREIELFREEPHKKGHLQIVPIDPSRRRKISKRMELSEAKDAGTPRRVDRADKKQSSDTQHDD